MPRKSENIYKRKDGRWEGRYIRGRDINQKAIYGYLYGKSYTEVKNKLKQITMTKTVEQAETINFAEIAIDWIENKKMHLEYCKNGLNTYFLPRFQNKILCMGFTLELWNYLVIYVLL